MPSGGQIAQAAVTGAVAGAITGLAGPEAGPLARIAAGAVANAAGQAVGNAMQGKPIMDGVGQAAITGAVTGGVMEGAGALAGKIGGDVEDGASSVLDDAGCSFTPATPVTTDHGGQSIGTLKVGEKVLAYNPKTKKMELQPILHVWITQDNDLVNLTLTTHSGHGNGAKLVSEVIHTNKKHPFLTVEKGFLPVGQIKLGMHVVEADGQVGVITGWALVLGVMTMYNLEVAHDHTFTVGNAQWIVHNKCDSTILRRNMKADSGAPLPDGYQAHHLIPCETLCSPKVASLIETSGFDINSADNGIGLPSTEEGSLATAAASPLPYHSSSHDFYTGYIQGQLEISYDDLEADGLLNDPLSAMNAITNALDTANAYIAELGFSGFNYGEAVRIS